MATIYSMDDGHLADADIRVGDDDLTLVAVRVSRSNALLEYYFVRGERAVWVDLGWGPLRGRLATRWQGGRRFWLIRLAIPAARPATAESRAPDHATTMSRQAQESPLQANSHRHLEHSPV